MYCEKTGSTSFHCVLSLRLLTLSQYRVKCWAWTKELSKAKNCSFFGSIVATCHTRNVVLRCFSIRTTDFKRVPSTHFSWFEELMSISNPSSKIILQQHLQSFQFLFGETKGLTANNHWPASEESNIPRFHLTLDILIGYFVDFPTVTCSLELRIWGENYV